MNKLVGFDDDEHAQVASDGVSVQHNRSFIDVFDDSFFITSFEADIQAMPWDKETLTLAVQQHANGASFEPSPSKSVTSESVCDNSKMNNIVVVSRQEMRRLEFKNSKLEHVHFINEAQDSSLIVKFNSCQLDHVRFHGTFILEFYQCQAKDTSMTSCIFEDFKIQQSTFTDVNCSGSRFFRGAYGVHFENVKFIGTVDFSMTLWGTEAEPLKKILFSNVHSDGIFQIGRAAFHCLFSFRIQNCSFSGMLFHADRTKHTGKMISIADTIFSCKITSFKDACITNLSFQNEVLFSGEEALFDKCKVVGDRTEFFGAKFHCSERVSFNHAHFETPSILFFDRETHDEDLSARTEDVRKCEFIGKHQALGFERATFGLPNETSGDALFDCSHITFQNKSQSFRNARFHVPTAMYGNIYNGAKTDFFGATFDGTSVRMKDCIFGAELTRFSSSHFACPQNIFFARTEFRSERSEFENMMINPEGNATFANVKFGNPDPNKISTANFRNTQFGRSELKGTDFTLGADLTDADLSETRKLEEAILPLTPGRPRALKDPVDSDNTLGCCHRCCAKKNRVSEAMSEFSTDGYEIIRSKFGCFGGVLRYAQSLKFSNSQLEQHLDDIEFLRATLKLLPSFQLTAQNWYEFADIWLQLRLLLSRLEDDNGNKVTLNVLRDLLFPESEESSIKEYILGSRRVHKLMTATAALDTLQYLRETQCLPHGAPQSLLNALKDVLGQVVHGPGYFLLLKKLQFEEANIKTIQATKEDAKVLFNNVILALGIGLSNFIGRAIYDGSGLEELLG